MKEPMGTTIEDQAPAWLLGLAALGVVVFGFAVVGVVSTVRALLAWGMCS